MASHPRKKCAFFNKGQGLQDLESFLIEDCHQSTPKQGDSSVGQAFKDIIKVKNLVKDVELVDSKKTGSSCCSNVNIEDNACPSLTKPSAYTTNSEPTNFNGIISGSVAALEDSEHSFAPTHTTLNHKGFLPNNSPVDDAVSPNTYTPEKKVYTQLLSVQTCQFDACKPYACSPSPSKHKVQSVGSIGNGTAPLSGAENCSSPCYDKVNDDYSDRINGQHPPPRPYTRRPSHPYRTYPVPSPSEECWSPKQFNNAKGEWSNHFESSYSALASSSSSSVFVECSLSNRQPRSCNQPNATAMSKHGSLMRGYITGTDFNRTAQQNQQTLGNCNHITSDIPFSKPNISVHASIQYDQGVQTYSHEENTRNHNGFEQNYLPPATTVNTSSALYRGNLCVPFSDKSNNHHHSGSSGNTGGVEFIPSSSSLSDRGAPIHVPPPANAIGLSAFTRVMPQRGYPQHRAAITGAGSYHSREPYSPPVSYSTTVNGSSCSDDSNPAFPSSSTTERKRVQSCKLCRNHGVETPIKGHKYLCPYKKCPCHNCSVTLKSRHFVKEQLKITRKQNVSASQHLLDCEVQHNEVKQPPASGVSFTMKEDMVKDMEKLNNLKLFMEIDKICRPQSSIKDSNSEKMGS